MSETATNIMPIHGSAGFIRRLLVAHHFSWERKIMPKLESSEQIANYFSEFGNNFNKKNFRATLIQAIKNLAYDDSQQVVEVNNDTDWPRKCEKCGTLHHFWWDWYECCR